MRIDRSHLPWMIFVILATVATTLLYLANFYPEHQFIPITLPAVFGEVPPTRNTFGGTPLGLLYGIIAFLIFVFAAALGIRKKRRLWPIGSVQFWLKAHIWLTILTLPLVAYHCGFRSGGTHTTWLIVLYAIVMGSGFFGLALQQIMPRMMMERLPREFVFEQIPHIRETLFEAALKTRQEIRALQASGLKKAEPVAVGAGGASEPVVITEDPSVPFLAEFLDGECLPYLSMSRGDKHRLGNEKTANDVFRLLKLNVAKSWETKVEELQSWCNDRRTMDLQMKLQHWLHGWLVIHVPMSFALIVFTAWHAWVAVRFLVIVH